VRNIGVIGGVGPFATSLYYHALVDKVVTETHGHLPEIILYSLPIDTEIEKAFIEGANDVDTEISRRTTRLLIQAIEMLKRCGIETIAMPCNTLQPLLATICAEQQVHNINLIEETSREVAKREVRCALIIGTNETCRSNIYGKALEDKGIAYKYPEEKDQEIVAQHISSSLRAPQQESPYLQSFLSCIARASYNVDGVVIACTDLTGRLLSNHLKIPVIDSLQTLVDRSVEY
jgi:aspartate racemase